MTDGTYRTDTPVVPMPTNFRQSQEQALELWPRIVEWVAELPQLRRVFLVGAGGSFVGLTALQFLLDRWGVTPSLHINPAEFMCRAPRSVGPDSLVLVFSGKGETQETVDAAGWAASRGARVAAVTMGAESPLAAAADVAFVGASGEGNQLLLQLVGLAILMRDGVDVGDQLAALRTLPEAIDAAVQAFEPRAAEIASQMKDVPVTYLIASGPLAGPGQTFTECFLKEMQWMHASTINANDFFQGPFEVFDRDTRSFLFLGEDSTRPMGERVLRFLEQYAGETVVIDGADLELPGVPEEQRGFVAPLVFYTLMFRLAAHYAAVRGYELEGRRYMWQFAY